VPKKLSDAYIGRLLVLGGVLDTTRCIFFLFSETWGQIGIGFDFRLYWIVDFIQVLVETCVEKEIIGLRICYI
jgi:hypothetical protein